jgi:hypothetical protein
MFLTKAEKLGIAEALPLRKSEEDIATATLQEAYTVATVTELSVEDSLKQNNEDGYDEPLRVEEILGGDGEPVARCENARCAGHPGFIPTKLTSWHEEPFVIPHPRLRESFSERRRWIDQDGLDVCTPSSPGELKRVRFALNVQVVTFYETSVPTRLCLNEDHSRYAVSFQRAQREIQGFSRMAPVLQLLRSATAVRYTSRGLADEVLKAVDEVGLD